MAKERPSIPANARMALANRDTRERFGLGRELSRTERTGGRRRVRGARRCRVLKIHPARLRQGSGEVASQLASPQRFWRGGEMADFERSLTDPRRDPVRHDG